MGQSAERKGLRAKSESQKVEKNRKTEDKKNYHESAKSGKHEN
jgi:hypothetical protein